MKLNCDLGERVNPNDELPDALIMPFINMANIACGFHASDPLTISNTIKLALTHNVSIGAHPSYNDRANFGRVSIRYTQEELIAIIQYQLGAIQAICLQQNTSLEYVKPHGALYNDMMKDLAIFESVCIAVSSFSKQHHDSTKKSLSLVIQALPNTEQFESVAARYKLTLLFEAFADREYTDEGFLVSRQQHNAVIHDAEKIIQRCNMLITQHTFNSVNGKPLNLKVDTLCVHGDNPEAIDITQKLSDLLTKAVQ
jgi:UPF0271 protein